MLLILFDFDPEIAAGTSLTLVALNSFAGTYTYTRLGFVDVRSGILFAVVAIPGSIIAPFRRRQSRRRTCFGSSSDYSLSYLPRSCSSGHICLNE